MTFISITTDQASGTVNQTIPLTITGEPGREVEVMQWVLPLDVAIGRVVLDASGTAVFPWIPHAQGVYTFYAQYTPCFLYVWCDKSNNITVNIGEGACDPLDPLCGLGQGWTQYQWIIIAVAIVIVFIVLLMIIVPVAKQAGTVRGIL